MPAPHDVMKTERRHVINHGLARFEHHARDCLDSSRVARPCHLNPFVRNLLGRKVWIPGQPTKSVPVGLREMMPGPVAIRASVGNTRHSCDALMIETSINYFR